MKGRIKLTFKDALGLLFPYLRSRIVEQIKSIWLLILYLILFQMMVLHIPISQGAAIALGIGMVIAGLTLFMEGLVLGLMPLGERVGIRLPQRAGILAVLLFSFVVGLLSTLAEPAIQVLQTAGKSVNAWEAPLLFMLLNQHANDLVLSVGCGVGAAVALGMLRFYYSWSIKPLIFILTTTLMGVTAWAHYDPNLRYITGLAWDCGAVTTGPVTVPLILALGVGISRMVDTTESGASGFGVVTLASLIPVLAVFLLGIVLLHSAPNPMTETEFFHTKNRTTVKKLFESDGHMALYALMAGGDGGRSAYFGESGEKMVEFAKRLATEEGLKKSLFHGSDSEFSKWVEESGPPEIKKLFSTGPREADSALLNASREEVRLFLKNITLSIKAICLLTAPLFFIMILILREKLPHTDEILLGLGFTVIGMCLFNMGIDTGLDRLGRQVGSMLPASFRTIDMPGPPKTISPFSEDLLYQAVKPDGNTFRFFFSSEGNAIETIPYKADHFDPVSRSYRFRETRGPLFGKEMSSWGLMIVLLFAFVMGYGATLAEPALNALGITVEELTVGTFKKSLLMQSVAIGVGMGILVGAAKIVWEIPLAPFLIPSYAILLILTLVSSEEFVNVAWDSAGVTTGPITVPLVLSMGLGIGSQVGVVEGFGILAAASVFPILSVLTVGLYLNRVRKSVLEGEKRDLDEGAVLNE